MGQFSKIANAFNEAIFETGYDWDWFQKNDGIITQQQKSELLGIIMKKMRGTCNPKMIIEFIEIEYSI